MNLTYVTLLTNDLVRIRADHLRHGSSNVCILAHGFLGSRRRPYIRKLSKKLSKHFDIVTFDFRGHGNSGGYFNGVNGIYDAKAVIDYVKSVGYKKITFVGFSFGGIAGVCAAARLDSLDALVIVSTPADVASIAPNASRLFWMCNNWVGRVILRIRVRLDDIIECPKPIAVIDQVAPTPLLMVYGEKDTLVSLNEAGMLYRKAREPKELVFIRGMNHPPRLPKEFYQTVVKWLVRIIR